MSNTLDILNALKSRDFHSATEGVGQVLQRKMQERLALERKSVMSEGSYTISTSTPPMPTNWRKGFQWPLQIGAGGTEEPFLQNGRWVLRVFDAKARKHYLYDFSTDMLLDESAKPLKEDSSWVSAKGRETTFDELKVGDKFVRYVLLAGKWSNTAQQKMSDVKYMDLANRRTYVMGTNERVKLIESTLKEEKIVIEVEGPKGTMYWNGKDFVYFDKKGAKKFSSRAEAAKSLGNKATGDEAFLNIEDDKRFFESVSEGTKYTTCPECDANFPSHQLQNGKLPPHKFNGKPCPGSGTLGESVEVDDEDQQDEALFTLKRKDLKDKKSIDALLAAGHSLQVKPKKKKK